MCLLHTFANECGKTRKLDWRRLIFVFALTHHPDICKNPDNGWCLLIVPKESNVSNGYGKDKDCSISYYSFRFDTRVNIYN